MKTIVLKTLPSLLFTLFFLSTINTYATDTPELRCLTVNTNGSITLHWTPVTDTIGFTQYVITRALAIIDTVSAFGIDNYTDNSADGNTGAYSYQVAAVYNLSTWNYSNHLWSIYLTTTSDATTNPGTATLTWNDMPLQPTSGNYTTYSDYNGASLMQPFGNTPINLTQTQNIYDCNKYLNHQVQVTDASGCHSQSNIVADTFSALGYIVGPAEMRCTSVLPNGQVKLTWAPSMNGSNDFDHYEVYRNGIYINAVNSFYEDTFVDATANGNSMYYNYYIITRSGCSGTETSGPSNTMNSLFLNTSNANPGDCHQAWNALPLLNITLLYDLHRTIAGNSVLLASTSTLNYTDQGLPPSTPQYQVFVTDIVSGCASNSNISSGCSITTDIDNLNPGKCNVQCLYNYHTQSIEIKSGCLTSSNINIDFYNVMGQLTSSEKINTNSDGVFSLSKNSAQSGLTFYSIKTDEGVYAGKIYIPQ